MENLQWIDDILKVRRGGLREPAVNTECCTKRETLPEGCVAVIMELLAKGAAENGCLKLQKAAEYFMNGSQLPELSFEDADEGTVAESLAEALEEVGKLPEAERDFIKKATASHLEWRCISAPLRGVPLRPPISRYR